MDSLLWIISGDHTMSGACCTCGLDEPNRVPWNANVQQGNPKEEEEGKRSLFDLTQHTTV
jgi:hypothetical protein